MKIILPHILYNRLSLSALLILSLTGCTYVRVCDYDGNPIDGANVTYQKFSIVNTFSAGNTNSDGELTLWPSLPAIENITVSKPGYLSSHKYINNNDVVYIVLSKDAKSAPSVNNHKFLDDLFK